LAFNVEPVKSDPKTIIVPDDYPTIQEAINAANDGDTIYVKSGTYYENVVVNKSLSLLGENKETTIIDGMGEGDAVHVTANHTLVSNFTMQNSGDWGGGLHLYEIVNSTVYSNNVKHNALGIQLEYSSNAILKNNNMTDNYYNFAVDGRYFEHFIHDVDTSNFVDGKPVVYWINQSSKKVPTDAGYVAILNSSNIGVENLTLANNGQNILLYYVSNSTIRNVTTKYSGVGIQVIRSSGCSVQQNVIYDSGHGIVLALSPNCSVYGNTMEKIHAYGVYVYRSPYCIISNNNNTGIYLSDIYFFRTSNCSIFNNIDFNIKLSYSSDCTISGNRAHKIRLYNSGENDLTSNNCTRFQVDGEYYNSVDKSNKVQGKPIYYIIGVADMIYDPEIIVGTFYMINGNNITIRDFRLTSNYCGVLLWNTTNSKITNVTASSNDYGIALRSSTNNTIVGNFALSNGKGISLSGSSNNTIAENIVSYNYYGIWINTSRNNVIVHNNFINNTRQVHSFAYTSYPPSINTWDNGYPSGGNYWSDHNPPDEDKDKIGDVSYVIDENNADRYPLIYPYGFVPKSDVNEDGIIDILDIATVAKAYGCKPGDLNWNPVADMDINEKIDIIDIATVAKDYGKTV